MKITHKDTGKEVYNDIAYLPTSDKAFSMEYILIERVINTYW